MLLSFTESEHALAQDADVARRVGHHRCQRHFRLGHLHHAHQHPHLHVRSSQVRHDFRKF